MKEKDSLLIMIHCAQFTGYAVGVLEGVFYDAAKEAGYKEENIFWSYKSVANDAPNVIECDYRQDDYAVFSEFLIRHQITRVIAFDLPIPATVISVLRKAGVGNIISYWGASMSSINVGLKLLLKKIECFSMRYKPNHFIFESEAMRLTATHGRGIPHHKTHVIPLGVDTSVYTEKYDQDFYAHQIFNIPMDHKIIFYSGHMEERKGVRVIVQAAIHLIEALNFENVHFVLCGNKDDEAAAYQKLLKGTEADAHVTFAGYRSDIAALMRSSYIGVIASTGWDSFTMSSVEMMSSGLPLIVSNLQGLAETIEHNGNGFHIKPGDHVDLAEKITHLLSNYQLAKNFSGASRARAKSLFSRERQVSEIANLLRSS